MINQLDIIQSAIDWACREIGIEWNCREEESINEIVPTLSDAWVLEAIRLYDVAAYDLNQKVISEEDLTSSPLPSEFQWKKGHPAAWYSGVRYASLIGRLLSLHAKHLYESNDKESAKLFIDKIWEYVVPFADAFINDAAAVEAVGRKRAIKAWLKSISSVTWSENFLEGIKNKEIYDRVFKHASENRDLRESVDACAQAVNTLLKFAESSKEEIQSIIDIAEPILGIDLDSLNDMPDLNAVAGTLSKMALLSEISRSGGLLFRVSGLLLRAHDLKISENKGWAVARCLEALARYSNEIVIDQNVQILIDILQTIVKTISADSLSVVLNSSVFSELWVHLPVDEQIKFIGSALAIIDEEHESYAVFDFIKFIRKLTEKSDERVLSECWVQVGKGAVNTKLFWVVECAVSHKTNKSLSCLLVDFAGIVSLVSRSDAINSEQYNCYIQDCFAELFSSAYNFLYCSFNTFVSCLRKSKLNVLNVWSILTIPFFQDLLIHEPELQNAWASLGIELLREEKLKHKTNSYLIRTAKIAVLNSKLCSSEICKTLDEQMNQVELEVDGFDESLFDKVLNNIIDENFKSIASRWSKSMRLKQGAENAKRLAAHLFRYAEKLNEKSMRLQLQANGMCILQWYNAIYKDLDTFNKSVLHLSSEVDLQEYLPAFAVVELPVSGVQKYRNSLVQGIEYLESKLFDSPWDSVDQSLLCKCPVVEEKIKIIREAETWLEPKIYKTKLSWWPEVELIQLRKTEKPSEFYLLALFRDEVICFDGTANPMHQLNYLCDAKIGQENVLTYLCFFCAFLEADGAPFYLLTNKDDPIVQGCWESFDDAVFIREPQFLGLTSEKKYLCTAFVLYRDSIYFSEFLVDGSGSVDLLNDELIQTDVTLKVNYLKKI